jgi:hypothetical protein
MFKFAVAGLIVSAALSQQAPNTAAQKEAMQKLSFLVGKWEGDASVVAMKGPVKVRQTELVQYKLDGLVMTVEGTGRDPERGDVVFQAFATIAYDDASKTYRFRSYNDGRYLDTELKVEGKGFRWGYDAGPAKVQFTMNLNAKGDWAETGEVTVGGNPPRKTFDMTVRK